MIVVLIGMVLLSLFIPAMVSFVNNEMRWTTGERKSTIAFHLAEAGIDRGIWKLKESTGTFNNGAFGIPITYYNFDKAFDDIEDGLYRIRFASGPAAMQVTIYAEGKEISSGKIRAIKCIVENQTVPGAIISGGSLSWQNDFEVHWGPIMAQDNITMTATAAKVYSPRKYSRQVVSGSASNPRDKNGLTPPNTDGIEWWSDYDVPDLPVFNFTEMRNAAAATNTLNAYGCSKGAGSSWTSWKCNSNYPTTKSHGIHIANLDRHPLSKLGYTWYWDGDVVLTGSTGSDGCGIIGNVIVRGNLTIDVGDNYYFTGNIPSEAWREYGKIDTATKNQYPGDEGYQKNRTTFIHGGETWTGGPPSGNTDVGIKGFIYVGGNLYLNNVMDISGAVWVVGNVSRFAGAGSDPMLVFYDSALSTSLPVLNVVLTRKTWEETSASTTAWP